MTKILTVDELKSSAVSIKEFGIGFIQVKYNKSLYLNFYTDRVPKFENAEAPHNHQRDFISRIMYGKIEETEYDVWTNDNCNLTAYCGCGDTEKEINEKYDFNLISTNIYQAGDYYVRYKEEFHSVEAENNTVTFVTKINYDESHDAIILSEKIEHKESEMSTEELWNIVDEILQIAKI